MLFTLTSMTTIGYGDLVPSTDAGKWFTMAFVTVGLAVLFLYLGRWGNTLARGFRYFYRYRHVEIRKASPLYNRPHASAVGGLNRYCK